MRIGNLGDLRVFLATVELGSLSKAARVLHLSLSAVSVRLKHLEEDLGCRLVVRTAKGLELTDAGRVLAREAAEVEKRLDQLLQAMAPFASEETATLRVAGNYNASVTVLPPAIRTFLSGHPEAEVEHLSMTSEGVVSAVAMGTVDVGVSAWTGTFQGVRFLPLETDRLVLVFPAAHPLAGKTAIDFTEVLDCPFVALTEASAMQNFILEKARVAGQPIRPRVRAESTDVLLNYIEMGVGIGVLPKHTCDTALAHRPELTYVPIENAWATRTLRIALPADAARRSRLSEEFLAILQASKV